MWLQRRRPLVNAANQPNAAVTANVYILPDAGSLGDSAFVPFTPNETGTLLVREDSLAVLQ